MDEYLEMMEEAMKSPLRHLSSALARVRTGRASLALLDDITIDYYGAATPLSGVASLSVPEPRMIIVKPWDLTMLPALEKAIGSSPLGINPNNDGKIIRLAFPELTGERRKELVKEVEKMGEDGKIGVRAVRKEYNDLFKKEQKSGEITEDVLKRCLDEVQKATDSHVDKIDGIIAKKKTEILAV